MGACFGSRGDGRRSQDRVAALPCWQKINPEVRTVGDCRDELGLGEGRTNENFIVLDADTHGQTVRRFVRVGADLPYYGVARVVEHAASRAAAQVGVAPKVLYTALPDVLVVEFVEGKTLTEEVVKAACQNGPKDPVLRSIVKSIQTLHQTAIPEDVMSHAKEMAGDTLGGWGGPHFAKWLAYAEAEKYSRLPLLEDCRELVAKLEAAAGKLEEPRFCHFDLLADNFVSRAPDKVLIIDFEYASPGQPLMDLAVLSMGCSLGPQEESALLSCFLGAVSERTAYGFKALRVLAALRETFWGVTGELSGSCALSPEECAAYTDKNYEKLLAMRADFEATSAPK